MGVYSRCCIYYINWCYGLKIDAGVWNTVLDAIGSILIAFGLVNNPTNKMGL